MEFCLGFFFFSSFHVDSIRDLRFLDILFIDLIKNEGWVNLWVWNTGREISFDIFLNLCSNLFFSLHRLTSISHALLDFLNEYPSAG